MEHARSEWRGLTSSRWVRIATLVACAALSLPSSFVIPPDIGVDSSWQISLQLASIKERVFGQDFIFTYGPLGYLLFHGATNKVAQLLYDLFVMSCLLMIYKDLLARRPRRIDCVSLILISVVIKMALMTAPSSILFGILCYWLWRCYDRGQLLAAGCAITTALLLFFGKVNYAVIVIWMIPVYGAAVLIQRRILPGLGLLCFPALVIIGSWILRVNLQGYLRSAYELIGGYNEAMVDRPELALVAFQLAILLLFGVCAAAWTGRRRLPWPEQIMILPLVAIGAILFFKNGFVCADAGHTVQFFQAVPLLLAVWAIAWRGLPSVRALLILSLVYPLALLLGTSQRFGKAEFAASVPLRYCRQAITAPWRESPRHLEAELSSRFPESVIPERTRSAIGQSSVDVMPWESSIAVAAGLNLIQRPVPQSYSTYTHWLDEANSRSHPAFILYSCAQTSTVGGRSAAWDESTTKRSVLENYRLDHEFTLPLRVWPTQPFEPATVFVLGRQAHARRLVEVDSRPVSLSLNQSLPIRSTDNLLYLALDVHRSISGKLEAALFSPRMLSVWYSYADGSTNSYRAVLPILRTGVLVNRRVESVQETRNWWAGNPSQNTAVTAIRFTAESASSIQWPLVGSLTEYELITPR